MLRLSMLAALLALIFASSPFFANARSDAGAAIPVYHH
jgi:hypothetical protein